MRRLLVIEDDPDQLNSCVFGLKTSDIKCEIETAATAEEAMRKLQDGGYDIVITDLHLTKPPENYEGFELINFIKQRDPWFERTKVIIWTIVGDQKKEDINVIRKALQLGVSDYIIKGWGNHIELLEKTIEKILLQLKISNRMRDIVVSGQVFIACPYDEHHDQICKALSSKKNQSSFKFVRADHAFKDDYLKEKLVTQIAASEFVIAFISGLNANVMYEIGLAHGMEKQVIIIKDERTEMVSNLRGISFISYKKDVALGLPDMIIQALNDISRR